MNVCVIGPIDDCLDACLDLVQMGYDPHSSNKAFERLSMIRDARALLRLGGKRGLGIDNDAEKYARELGRPVYVSIEQLRSEMPAPPPVTITARQKRLARRQHK